MQQLVDFLHQWLLDLGLGIAIIPYVQFLILFTGLVILAMLLNVITKRVLLQIIYKLSTKTATNIDDLLVKHKVFHRLSHVVPVLVVYKSGPIIFNDFIQLLPFVLGLTDVYVIVVMASVIHAVLNTLKAYLESLQKLNDKPINSFIQVFKVINYFVATILVISVIVGKSPVVLFSALGAATAVLLLVFKDTILGLVASIQLTVNDMIRVGDWVTLDKYGADGDITEINLTTIKVRNFDNTITTIPPYALVSDSVKNWRGMTQSGGRRIKRAIYLKMSSVRFCDEHALQHFEKIQLVTEYIQTKRAEIEAYNLRTHADKTYRINGRNFTNLGIFRQYALQYLRRNPNVNQEMTVMVRQLAPTEKGIPLEIYCFSADKAWVNYEGIQADIFDHLIAAIPDFELEVVEIPTGSDIKSLVQKA